MVACLNEAGRSDIVVMTALVMTANGATCKKRRFADFVRPGDLAGWLDGRKLDAVIHLGAISDTTATDAIW